MKSKEQEKNKKQSIEKLTREDGQSNKLEEKKIEKGQGLGLLSGKMLMTFQKEGMIKYLLLSFH